MTTKEIEKTLKTDAYALDDWHTANVKAIQNIDAVIETLTRIRAELAHDKAVLSLDQTRIAENDKTTLKSEREARLVESMTCSLGQTTDSLEHFITIR